MLDFEVSFRGNMMDTGKNLADSEVTVHAQIVYGLILLGPFLTGFPIIVGILWMFVNIAGNKGQGGHTRFQIRTFWLALMMAVVGGICFSVLSVYTESAITDIAILMFMVLCSLLLFGWIYARLISGWHLALAKKPLTNSNTWGFIAR